MAAAYRFLATAHRGSDNCKREAEKLMPGKRLHRFCLAMPLSDLWGADRNSNDKN